MQRTSIGLVTAMVMVAGAAAIAQQGTQPQRPGQQPGQPSAQPGQPSTQPGQRPSMQPGQTPGQTRPGQGLGRPSANEDFRVNPEMVQKIIGTWPQESQKAARETMEKYGDPIGVTPDMIIWRDNGPWKKTVVYAEAWEHHFPMEHKDVLLNVIDYKVPVDQFDELARFDGSIIASRTPGELAARCDKEEMNFVALNLAHEIVTGKRTVEDARAFLAQQAELVKQGQTSTYSQGLMFETNSDSKDPDRPANATGRQGADGILPGQRPGESPGMAPGSRPGTNPRGTTPEPRTPNTPR